MKPYNKALKNISRQLRSNMTDAEQLLWKRLRRKQICGLLFNRQKPLLNFIVDFYCARAQLVIELDGSQHFEVDYKRQDQARDIALSNIGLTVLRFDNRQVLLETESVLAAIELQVRRIPPNPPLIKGGT